MRTFTISLYHDKRRKKLTNNKYPVKLNVYDAITGKQKLFNTGIDLHDDEFKGAWTAKRILKQYTDINEELSALLNRSVEVARQLTPFTFDAFETRMRRKAGDGIKIIYHYDRLITRKRSLGKISTAESYRLSLKSLTEFSEMVKNKSLDNLTFYDITVEWLEDYEHYMLNLKDCSLSTVGVYLRPLRIVFNNAITDKELDKEYYPFGVGKYQIPTSENTKRTLSPDEVRTLYFAEARTPEQEKARDFWILSYSTYGMNIKDIALLKFGNIQNGVIEFVREKTKSTNKKKQRTVRVGINETAEEIIKKYQKDSTDADSYVFDILHNGMTPSEIHRKVKIFTKFINQHLKKLAADAGITKDISSYWARHSAASHSLIGGSNIMEIKQSLGHSDVRTTQSYLTSIEDEQVKKMADKLMIIK